MRTYDPFHACKVWTMESYLKYLDTVMVAVTLMSDGDEVRVW